MKTKSALSWFGSDSEVAEQLAAMLNHCSHVTIPFCGGLAILPHLTARAIVANDKHEQAINFYRCVSGVYGPDAKARLLSLCEHTLSHPSEIANAEMILNGTASHADSAWAFWALCWIGRKGKGGTKNQVGMPSIRRTAGGGTNASRVRAVVDDLPAWAKEFERCEWECQDFRLQLDVVADRLDCGLYIDGPWDGPGAGYLHSFTAQDHYDLARAVQRFHQTTVVIRYGDTPLIRSLYEGWRIIDAESRTQANTIKGEVWITNRTLAV